MKNKSELVQG